MREAVPTDPATTEPVPPRRFDGLVGLAVAGLVAATVLVGALAPGAAPRIAARTPVDDPACAEWTDGCRVCRREAGGVACSLPGIACTKAAPTCLAPG